MQHAADVHYAAESVTIEFDMTDRQVPENSGVCDVSLSKRGKLDEDIHVRVRALTIVQFENMTGSIFPGDIPPAEGGCHTIIRFSFAFSCALILVCQSTMPRAQYCGFKAHLNHIYLFKNHFVCSYLPFGCYNAN